MKQFFTAKFISDRLIYSKNNTFSRSAYFIGIFTISIGICSMLIFSLLLGGLQKSISSKVFNMSGHINVKKYYFVNSYQEFPMLKKELNIINLNKQIPQIKKIYAFAHSTALIKGKKDINGILFKGIDLSENNYKHLLQYIIEGRFFKKNEKNSIIISKKIADQLNIKIGERILTYFLNKPPRHRKLKVIGIYKTNIPDIDEKFALTSLSLIQEINSWSKDMIGGYEILLNDISTIKNIYLKISNSLNRNLRAISIHRKFISLFDWLSILEKNKNILLILIMIVISANIISIILIQLIDRTYMTGVLISLGADNNTIASIFIWNILNILFRGILFGNILGLSLCAFQHFTKFFKLDPDGVYLDYAVIDWNLKSILFINAISIFIISIVTIIFIHIILRIRPIKALEFK